MEDASIKKNFSFNFFLSLQSDKRGPSRHFVVLVRMYGCFVVDFSSLLFMKRIFALLFSFLLILKLILMGFDLQIF